MILVWYPIMGDVMRRVSDDERLTHRFMVNCTKAQHDVVMDEAKERQLAPGIVARMAFAEGLAEVRRKRLAVRRQISLAKRKAKGGTDHAKD